MKKTIITMSFVALCFAMPVMAAEPSATTPKQTKFERIDTNHDGAVSQEELLADYQATATKRFTRSDKDKDGKLSATEFSKPKKVAVAK